MVFYRLCKFKRFGLIRYAWVCEKGLEEGSIVRFKDSEDELGGAFWKVVSVGSMRLREKAAEDKVKAYLQGC